MTNARTIADSAGEATVLDVTAGTAAASKAVVLDASKNIATLGTVGSGAITSSGAISGTTINGIPFHLNSDDDSTSIYTHDVSGTDNLARSNTAYGVNALDAITTGDNNTAIGYLSLSGNNTGTENTALGRGAMSGSTSASYNVAIGNNAGAAMTTGDLYNTLVGNGAGSSLTSGNRNIFMGASAGDGHDTETHNLGIGVASLGGSIAGGEYNVAIGNYSLDALTSADSNVAIGYEAGSGIQDGGFNVFVGQIAGKATNSGTGNVAVGRNSLVTNTSGSRNVALGQNAVEYPDTENDNVGIGYNALAGTIAGGEFNVAIGNQSLDAVTSGDDNLAAGYNSGTNITSGTDNVAIGKDAMSVVVGGSGNICLGSGADVADGAADFTTAIGFQVGGTAGYTTIGKTTDDIRAAHGNTTWNTVSDERFKKNIETSDAGLAVINDLRPVTYNWKTKGEVPEWSEIYEQGSNEQYKNSKHNHGFIAQEVKAVIDSHSELKDGFNMWDERPDGQQEVGETAIVPILVKAVQELSATVTTLQQEINTLKGE